ncbi:MAG: PhzF family phenazine biosynthesis protein [Bacillota bacterium]
MIYYIVDVFALEKYKGNQLAVFRDVGDLSSVEMQKIAKETNYSETTFILSDETRDGGYDVRIFTPNEEIPFAGHPTLGTAFIIRDEIMKEKKNQLTLNLKVGGIPVKFDQSGTIWMKQKEPTFERTYKIDKIASLLNLDQFDFDEEFPIEDVSTGLPFLIVPLKNLAAVKKAKINQGNFSTFIEGTRAQAILVFSRETYHSQNDLNVRVFVDVYGLPEDPATGSANGCLAGYLVKHRYFGDSSIDIKVEQGYEIQRQSLLHVKAEENNGAFSIHVGGNVVKVAKGEWY